MTGYCKYSNMGVVSGGLRKAGNVHAAGTLNVWGLNPKKRVSAFIIFCGTNGTDTPEYTVYKKFLRGNFG